MRRFFLKTLLLIFSFLTSGSEAPVLGQNPAQAPVKRQAPLFFRVAISQYFQVPQEQVALAGRGKIKEEELPVLFLIVQKGQVSLEKVAQRRSRGASWLTTAREFGVTPEAFYSPLKKAEGIFRKPFTYYKSRKRVKWKGIVLKDKEIVSLVNLKFLSEFYKRPPEQIAGWHNKGKSFVEINAELQSRAENR